MYMYYQFCVTHYVCLSFQTVLFTHADAGLCLIYGSRKKEKSISPRSRATNCPCFRAKTCSHWGKVSGKAHRLLINLNYGCLALYLARIRVSLVLKSA